jgi:hypothetical protein
MSPTMMIAIEMKVSAPRRQILSNHLANAMQPKKNPMEARM